MPTRDRQDDSPLFLQDVSLTGVSPPITLSVEPSEFVCFYGDTPHVLDALSDSIAGYDETMSGKIFIGGTDCTHWPAMRRHVGVIDDRDPLFEHLSVTANIAFPLSAIGTPSARITAHTRRIIALLSLEAVLTTPVANLTAEQQFRVKLGRLIAYNPTLILLNQPFTQMSDFDSMRCNKLLKTVQRASRLTVLHLTTRRRDLFAGADRVAVFKQAACVQCADIATLVTRPANPHVARVIGRANTLTGYIIQKDEGVAQVRLASGGVLPAMADDDCDVDTICTLCIRPEHIALSTSALHDEDDAHMSVSATIQDIQHFGDFVRLRCKLLDGTEIDIRRAAMQYSKTMHIDQNVYLAWSAGQALALSSADET